jgi:NNP family nitrate/nitrite transporter-like MFS transporter
MVWICSPRRIPITKTLGLNATEFGPLTATPVLTGSLIVRAARHLTDRYGGCIVMVIPMALTVPAIWLMTYATEYWHFLVIGLVDWLGLVLGRHAVRGALVPAQSPGFAMGVRRRQFGSGRQ